MAVCVENIDEPVVGTCNVVVLLGVLFCVRHNQIASDVCNSEGREADRYAGIMKIAIQGGRFKAATKDVDASAAEIGRVQNTPAVFTPVASPL